MAAHFLKLNLTRRVSFKGFFKYYSLQQLWTINLCGRMLKRLWLGELCHLSLLSVSCFPEQLPLTWLAGLPALKSTFPFLILRWAGREEEEEEREEGRERGERSVWWGDWGGGV